MLEVRKHGRTGMKQVDKVVDTCMFLNSPYVQKLGSKLNFGLLLMRDDDYKARRFLQDKCKPSFQVISEEMEVSFLPS